MDLIFFQIENNSRITQNSATEVRVNVIDSLIDKLVKVDAQKIRYQGIYPIEKILQ
jgi:hypothetical protein